MSRWLACCMLCLAAPTGAFQAVQWRGGLLNGHNCGPERGWARLCALEDGNGQGSGSERRRSISRGRGSSNIRQGSGERYSDLDVADQFDTDRNRETDRGRGANADITAGRRSSLGDTSKTLNRIIVESPQEVITRAFKSSTSSLAARLNIGIVGVGVCEKKERVSVWMSAGACIFLSV